MHIYTSLSLSSSQVSTLDVSPVLWIYEHQPVVLLLLYYYFCSPISCSGTSLSLSLSFACHTTPSTFMSRTCAPSAGNHSADAELTLFTHFFSPTVSFFSVYVSIRFLHASRPLHACSPSYGFFCKASGCRKAELLLHREKSHFLAELVTIRAKW